MQITFYSYQITPITWVLQRLMADPGFPRRGRGGGAAPEVGAETYYLARFLPKTAWKWKKIGPGCVSLAPPWIRQWSVQQLLMKIQMHNLQIIKGIVTDWTLLDRIDLHVARWWRKAWYLDTRGFILKKIQWHIHTGPWSLVNCWCEALTRHYIRCSWILMTLAVGLMEWPWPW